MAAGVLHDVSLGYQLLWNARRQPDQVWLNLAPHNGRLVNTGHLLASLSSQWSEQHTRLTLSTRSAVLLADLLDITPPTLAQIEVTDTLLSDPAIAQRVWRARQRGLSLVWHGEPGARPQTSHAQSFTQTLLSLSADDVLQHLRQQRAQSKVDTPPSEQTSHFAPGTVLDGVANAGLLDYFLKQPGVTGLMDWPSEDVLFACRQTRAQPRWQVLQDVIGLIQADAAMEDVAHAMSQEPLLVYRFLRYANSAGLGLNREITALRHGLMVLGLGRLKTWLQEQLPHAAKDLNLRPVATLMVMRARFMTELLDAGAASALQQELELCGLLSQMDLLTGEPLQQALHPIPLPERVSAALLGHSGPYWPYLDIANALATGQPLATREACLRHGFEEEVVNLALLRSLRAQPASSAKAAACVRPPGPARQSHPRAHPSLH
jgi:hypothetical protein